MGATMEPPARAGVGWRPDTGGAQTAGAPLYGRQQAPEAPGGEGSTPADDVRSFADYLIDEADHRITEIGPAPTIPAGALGLALRAPSIDLGDIEVMIERYLRQERVLQTAGVDPPVLVSGSGLPMLIDLGLPHFDMTGGMVEVHRERLIAGFLNSLPTDTAMVNWPEARDAFRARLVALLTARLAPPPSEVPAAPPGYLFTVHTKHTKLRIHYSHTLFVSRDQAFGAPTTPVSRYLQPGWYTFGAYGSGCPSEGFWDRAEYYVPSQPNAAYLDI